MSRLEHGFEIAWKRSGKTPEKAFSFLQATPQPGSATAEIAETLSRQHTANVCEIPIPNDKLWKNESEDCRAA